MFTKHASYIELQRRLLTLRRWRHSISCFADNSSRPETHFFQSCCIRMRGQANTSRDGLAFSNIVVNIDKSSSDFRS